MRQMSSVAIYHPSINLPTGEWLQLSLLYWERLLRISPSQDSRPAPRHTALLEEADLIRRIDPSPSLSAVSQTFLSVVREQRDELSARYKLSSGSAWRGIDGEPWDVDPGLTYVHADKLSPHLRAELTDSGMAIWDPDGWIGTHPRLARTYMALLAGHISETSAATPVTDDPVAHLLGNNRSTGELAESLLGSIPSEQGESHRNDPSASLAFISVKAVAPEASLSVEEILDLRARYGDELMRFRELLATIIDEAALEAVSRPDMLQMHLDDLYVRKISPELTQLKRDLRLLNVKTVDALINVRTTLPPALAIAAGQAGIHEPAVTASAAAVVSIIGIARSLASAKEEALTQSRVAFLWQLDREESRRAA
jgi:hypothetical protein